MTPPPSQSGSLRVWTCSDFEGHYPVGTAAVVVAPDVSSAMALLAHELKRLGLPGDSFSVDPLPTDEERVRVLVDGTASSSSVTWGRESRASCDALRDEEQCRPGRHRTTVNGRCIRCGKRWFD